MAILEKVNLNDSQSEASRKIFDNDTRISQQAVAAETAAKNASKEALDASTAAGKAQTAADNAQTSANNAQTTANNAKNLADKAQETADLAIQEIEALEKSTADGLEGKTDIEMFLNVSQKFKKYNYSDSTAARNAVPAENRALGQVLVYQLADTGWKQEVFIGTDISQWAIVENWRSLGGGNRIFEGGRADSVYGGGRVIDCGGADAVFNGELIDCGGAIE